MKSIRLIFITAACHLLMAGGVMSESSDSAYKPRPEYEVKVAFIYNFLRYVTWPKDQLPDNETLVVRIAGEFNHCRQLEVLSQKSIGSHKISVKEMDSSADIQKCHVVFIAAGAENLLPDILSALEGQAVLIISDSDSALGHGAVIAFYVDGCRIRFKIDRTAADRHGLKISSKLLRLATIVNSEDDKEPQR